MRTKTVTAIVLLSVLGIAVLGAEFFGFINLNPNWPPPQWETGDDAIPVFKITDGATDAVFSPADASVIIYDPGSIHAMPSGDVAAFEYVDTLGETPDGEFTATMSLTVGRWLYVYATGTNWYTAGWFVQVQPLRSGTSGESEPISLRMHQNSGTITSDISGMLVSGGAEVDGQDATNNVTFGAASYRLDLTVAENYAYANKDYVDPTTGYFYRGTFVVLDLDLTTARCTVTGSAIFEHFTISSHEYWVLSVAQFFNDADLSDDGTYSLSFTIDVTVGADDAMDVGYYGARRAASIKQASFGTDHENNDDNLDNLNFATS